MHTAGFKGEPLVEIPPEIREEWIETLDRAIEAMGTVGVGLAQAMNTLKALESETFDFPFTGLRTACPKFSNRARPTKRRRRSVRNR